MLATGARHHLHPHPGRRPLPRLLREHPRPPPFLRRPVRHRHGRQRHHAPHRPRRRVHSFTILGWEVQDIDTAVATLTAEGVSFARYPFLEQSETGIWTAPSNAAKLAWFQDPDGNTLSQHLTA